MSDIEEQGKSIEELNASAPKSKSHWRARCRQVLAHIRKVLQKNGRCIRRSRRHSATDLTDEVDQETDPNDRSSVKIEPIESRSEPIESVNEQASTPTHITPVVQINSPTGAQLVML
ncbi:unnamed protein product [Rotaria sordida]|uniref:Uncharacterized protein n=1 Tax=Rotaria sordida TaxID=392033 RepID=A0A815PTY5_9BILA|nr:unnamed protein product [Rotaria sordida]